MRNKQIPVSEPKLYGEELKFVTDCIKTNWISSKGKYIEEFEKKVAEFVGVKYAVAVSNGTVAVHLALISAGIKPGDEIITPALTTVCSINPIFYSNAKPVLVDSNKNTLNIDEEKIEKSITKKTRAILPVHLYGYPCEMDVINDVAERHDILVIEDAAEAIGTEYKGRKAGSLSDVATFSFYANKVITTGEGGMLLTDDHKIAENARSLRNQAYGKETRFLHHSIGYNYRMTNIQAAIGCGQIKHVKESVRTKIRIANLYTKLLKNVEGITPPPTRNDIVNTYWMYTVLIEQQFGINRDKFAMLLKEMGIETRPVFYPIHKQPAYDGYFGSKSFPVAESISNKGINLPSGNTLSNDDIKYVVESIIKVSK